MLASSKFNIWYYYPNIYTVDKELGEINPSKFFANKSDFINRIWIGMNESSDKVDLDLSTGSLNFDRQALDDIRICA